MPQQFSVFVKSKHSQFLRHSGSLLLALAFALSAASPAGGMLFVRKLSAERPVDYGPVHSFFFSPNNKYVVYTTDTLLPGLTELFSVPATGGSPVRLNLDLMNGGKVDEGSIAITPDSLTVVYRADQNGDSLYEIYTVPITGGESHMISSGFMVAGGGVQSFALSPSGEWVVYRADQEADNVYELYSVSIHGGEITRLNASFFPEHLDSDVSPVFLIRPDSEGVVFQTNEEDLSKYELYVNSMDGGDLVELSGTGIAGSVTDQFSFTANTVNPAVVFKVFNEGGFAELYGNLLDAPFAEPLKLSRDLTGVEFVEEFALTHDGLRAVYSICTDLSTGEDLLYSRLLAGGPTITVSGGSTMHDIFNVDITPNDARSVFISDRDLYSNSITSEVTEPVKINAAPSGDGYVASFQITSSSVGPAGVVYLQNQTAAAGFDLYSAYAAGGSTRYQLNQSLHENDSVSEFSISPNNMGVVYIADQETDGVDELYLNSILGGTPIKLSLPISNPAGDVEDFKISPNSQLVAYRVDQDVDNKYELYVAFTGYGIFVPVIKH